MKKRTNQEVLDMLGIMKPELWEEDGRWLQPPLPWSFFGHWHRCELVKQLFPNEHVHTIFSVHGYAFWHVESRKIIYRDLEKRHREGRLQELVDTVDAEGRRIFAHIRAELAHDDEYIRANIFNIFDTYREFIGTWTMSTALGDQMVQLAKSAKYITSDAELFAKVHPHLRATWIEQEVERMVSIAKLVVANESKEKVDSEIKRYISDFTWCRISKWIGEPIDEAYARKRLVEEVENVKQGNHSKIHRTEETDRNLDGIVAVSVCSAYWRAQSAMIEMNMALRMRLILKQIAEKNGWNYTQVVLLTPNELAQVIQSEDMQIPNKAEILLREKEFFNTATNDGEEIVITPSDPEYAVLKKMYIKEADTAHVQTGILKGIGASLGKVTGKVRVIASSSEFADFQTGEILVAAETSPTFVPLMRASSAILTGKGGITSHAAIVSRELGKPCIIAIKDVTKILKNGDMVEIDAEKGTVKILK